MWLCLYESDRGFIIQDRDGEVNPAAGEEADLEEPWQDTLRCAAREKSAPAFFLRSRGTCAVTGKD